MYNNWCLGFVFSSDFRSVALLRKGKSLHVGLWNGVGGALELEDRGSSLNAMVRECEEETGLQISTSKWAEVGKLVSDEEKWVVAIYTAKLENRSNGPEVLWLERLNDHKDDHAGMVPLELLYTLKMAPHTGALIFASLEKLCAPKTPVITFNV